MRVGTGGCRDDADYEVSRQKGGAVVAHGDSNPCLCARPLDLLTEFTGGNHGRYELCVEFD